MKSRIATFLIALCMFMAGTAFAINPVNQNTNASKAVASLLKQEIDYPKFAKEENFEYCVLVRIIISQDGTFKADCVNCNCSRMKAHVIKVIENINMKEFSKYAGKEFNFKIDFKLI
ncbi:MAG: hypothetical protein HQ521_21695 [Bacteroidetes bacterium]|nr:hypothetical protein [Bacteroidota bacterium]